MCTQVRHYIPSFHEIIDRAAAAHHFRFGALAATMSHRGGPALGSPPRKSSANGSPPRRASVSKRGRNSARRLSSVKERGGFGSGALAKESASESLHQSIGGDSDWALGNSGSDQQWTFASASLEISTAPLLQHEHV